MKIKYSKKHLRFVGILGIIWLLLFILMNVFDGQNYWSTYGYLFLSIIHFIYYLYERSNQYMTIDSSGILIHALNARKLAIDEIVSIRKIGQDYIIRSERRKIRIKTAIIDKESLEQLEIKLNEIEATL